MPAMRQTVTPIIGKFGPFIACSGYPECKYIQQIKASFHCPLDGGDVHTSPMAWQRILGMQQLSKM